ncbi:hypothetical protein G3580_06685 [Nitrogeniibacter mangrovi]|uniref:Major facilitator superfamily (MFS) profile domain-containing protein n=1 Tax=Nitrogeniibacter mangrovi TaxID=2016596 RepID=A0A6C1B500_9RHOO|nr:hypothetical protein [Nitrogeniibacter mangrovi]QID17360.1 hypothetical protein G3580_06685 [Nitrogeniibacter mangrovi]
MARPIDAAMQSSFLRTLLVCAACAPVAGTLGAQAAVFPLLITAMSADVRGRADATRVAAQLASHMISAASAAALGLLDTRTLAFGQGALSAAFPVGCVLLLSLQFTRLRHPPAMASGGAVLCGVNPLAVVGCAIVTGLVLVAETLLRGVRRGES